MTESLIEFVSADEALALQVLEQLRRHYPGFPWIVQAIHSQGQVTIQNPALSYKFGMRIKIGSLANHDEAMRKVVNFAGEFLERHNVSRTAPGTPDKVTELFRKGRFN